MNQQQLEAAQKLRAERPAVIPGTNVIVDQAARLAWYAKVTAVAKQVGGGNEFFDEAGVPN